MGTATLVVSNTSLLVADSAIAVSLTGTNFMGSSSTATVMVSVAGEPLPNVVINSAMVRDGVSATHEGDVSECD